MLVQFHEGDLLASLFVVGANLSGIHQFCVEHMSIINGVIQSCLDFNNYLDSSPAMIINSSSFSQM